MTENNETNQADAPKKKMTLKEAMQQQLEAKKNQASNNTGTGSGSQSSKKMQSQQTKKVSNLRRKMGT
ncbi:hypothetical protein [Paenisporosarcina sp. TG20]|uniref:hypothetical protein n=1 Tax=Paenisporosarcina sp. TG20 TaxID=1211706 RepID=UPI0002DE4CC1|nr:hypothetical protein [Paenisporosarcina sp. TG20]